jgi:predicted O-methyltransferase YrrM
MDFAELRDLALSFDQGPTGDPFLDGRYRWQVEEFGHPKPYYRLFYRLSELLRPRMVVELGAWKGTGAAHWAPHAGAVVTIDHHSDPGDDENERWCLEAAQHYPNLHYVKGWTWDVTEEVQMFGRWIDVLFIDSWHHYDKAMRDWEAYSPKLRPEGALVICDDIEDVEPTLHEMERFWREVSAGRERFLLKNVSTYPMGFFKWTA